MASEIKFQFNGILKPAAINLQDFKVSDGLDFACRQFEIHDSQRTKIGLSIGAMNFTAEQVTQNLSLALQEIGVMANDTIDVRLSEPRIPAPPWTRRSVRTVGRIVFMSDTSKPKSNT